MTAQVSITPEDRRLLGRVLRSSNDKDGIVATRFRAENPKLMERLDLLESDRLLSRKDDRYFLTLVALSEIQTSEARAIMRDARRIYRLLVDSYRKVQLQPVLVRNLAAASGLSAERVILVLGYMLQGDWYGGHSNLLSGSEAVASVMPSERVLILKTFSAVVNRARIAHSEHMNSPRLGRPRELRSVSSILQSSTIAQKADSQLHADSESTSSSPPGGDMAVKKVAAAQERAQLIVPFLEAQAKVQKQIDRAAGVPNESVNQNDEVRRWYEFTKEVLRQIFSTDELADEFAGKSSFSIGGDISTGSYLKRLLSIHDRLELFSTPSTSGASSARASAGVIGKRVFIVHGHDDGTRETVARYVSKLGLNPVILHEQPNEGRTIIEKFEGNSAVAFAVVLFTPDDFGHPAGMPEAIKPRPRQNVILELGFFMHALGRKRVCVLYKQGVEIPSDYSGVLYQELDTRGAWKPQLAIEMRAAGLPIDMNLAF